MSSTEGIQPQNWPELDVRYFRWDPPVYPNANPGSGTNKGQKTKIESAFAHVTCPPRLAGWDAVKAANAAKQQPAGAELHGQHHDLRPGSLQPGPPAQVGHGQDLQSHTPGPGASTLPKQGGLSWSDSVPSLSYGSSFDDLFGSGSIEAAGLRFGVPQNQSELARQTASTTTVGQPSAPFLTVQCGKFTAPVQRDTQGFRQGLMQQQMDGWSPDHRAQFLDPRALKGPSRLERAPSLVNAHQLQEYYTAQSDLLEGFMRNQAIGTEGRDMHAPGGRHMEHEMGNMYGVMPLGRANSALEVPPSESLSSPSPYMPQWQSESVPAELPNHVVNRLLMSGSQDQLHRGHWQHRGGSLAGGSSEWGGLPHMPSIPDGRELPIAGLEYPGQASSSNTTKTTSNGQHGKKASQTSSPDVNHLEELARTADVEVAHRAFLVPPHKKRGKGGRQPASDPRLDPSIDERRAKRILANRLSAARSKMKQKNQMDVLSGIIKQLEGHNKELSNDAAELMEVCEALEFENRRMTREGWILEEFLKRRGL